MSKISSVSIVFFVSIFSMLEITLAIPTDPTLIPILKPETFALVNSSTTTENSDTIIVEAEEQVVADDGEAIEGTTDATGTTSKSESDSSGVKEFDPSDCFLVKARGPCRVVIDSWFFNVGTKTCEPFVYSGCRGNNNRFAGRLQCETHCAQPTGPGKVHNLTTTTTNSSTTTTTTATTTTTVAPISNQPQKLKPKLPDCPKFEGCSDKCVIIQDRSDRGCKKCLCGSTPSSDEKVFVSSGNLTVLQPNISIGSVSGLPANTSAEDESNSPILGSPNEVCNLPVTRGDCRAMLTRYRYDAQTKDCVQFHFGGCDGNGNNFVSKEKCIAYCKGQ